MVLGGVLVHRARAGHPFFDHSPPVPVFAPTSPNNLEYLLAGPILCTQFMMMARVVVGSGESDILCC